MAGLSHIKEVTSDYIVALNDELICVVTTGTDITVTLPPQPVVQGAKFTIFRPSGPSISQVFINGNGALINGLTQITLNTNDNVTVVSFDGAWIIPMTNIYGTVGPTGPTGPTGGGGSGGRVYAARDPGTFTGTDTTLLPSVYYGSTAIPAEMIQPGAQIRIVLRGTFTGVTGSLIEFQIIAGTSLVQISTAFQTLSVLTGLCPFEFDGVISVITVTGGGANAVMRGNFMATIGKGNSTSLPGDNSIGSINFNNATVPITTSVPIDVRFKHTGAGDIITIHNASIIVE
jgi:hypothetical protein